MAGIDAILGDPVWAALLGLVALIGSVIVFNRGRWWVVNLLAQKEPLAVAAGVALVVWSVRAPGLGGHAVAGVSGRWLLAGVGVALVGLGLVTRYTELVDL